MINIIIEISIYIFVAIALGYFFGWLITRLLLKQKYEIDLEKIMLNKKLSSDDDQKSLFKDELIAKLTSKLTLMDEKQIIIEKKHEEEINAFIFERTEIIQKYKSLVEQNHN
jgi:hypothetical protein